MPRCCQCAVISGYRPPSPDMTVAPAHWAGATVVCLSSCRSGCELQAPLAEDAEVSAPELGVVDGTDRSADAVRETSQVVDEQLRTRPVSREAVARVGQHERVREVRV